MANNLPNTEEEAISFLREKQCLHAQRVCVRGHGDMQLCLVGDVYKWYCRGENCLFKPAVRDGTWFKKHHDPLFAIVKLIFAWCEELRQTSWGQRQLTPEINERKTTTYRDYLREWCVLEMMARTQAANGIIGGPGLVVEIGQCFYINHDKQKDRKKTQLCAFGGVCRRTGEFFLVQVADKFLETITPQIHQYVKDGSVLSTQYWSEYCKGEMNENTLKPLTDGHNYQIENFTMPIYGQRLETEEIWGTAKWLTNPNHGEQFHRSSYFAEFMFLQANINGDLFNAILGVLAREYAPEIPASTTSSGVQVQYYEMKKNTP